MWSRSIIASSLALAASLELASAARGSPQLETTVPMSASAFARLARSQEFYRSTRASGDLSKQEVVELGDWVQWEFQHEDDESPLAGEDVNEVVPSPPAGMKGEAGLALKGVKGGGLKGSKAAAAGAGRHSGGEDEQGPQQMFHRMRRQMYAVVASPVRPPQLAGAVSGGGAAVPGPAAGAALSARIAAQGFFSNVARRTGPLLRSQTRFQGLQQQGTEEAHQMYRKVRLKYAVSSPIGSSHSEGAQGHTLREGKDEVIYTETDCISGLPMFRGDLVVKTTYRVTPSEEDPDNSVVVKVSVVVRDVKLARAAGWLGRAVKVMVRDSGKKQAASTLKQMVEAKSGTWA